MIVEIIKNTFFSFWGLPILATILLLSAFFDNKNKSIDKKGIIKYCSIFLIFCLCVSTYKYATKEYDSSDTKLQYNLNSSTFYAIGYDERFNKAELIFNNDVDENGVWKAYIYDLPKSVWDEFRCSSSLGEFYNNRIKGKYKSYVEEYDWYNPREYRD